MRFEDKQFRKVFCPDDSTTFCKAFNEALWGAYCWGGNKLYNNRRYDEDGEQGGRNLWETCVHSVPTTFDLLEYNGKKFAN